MGADGGEPGGGRAAIDDCWNRIGIRGDASCPQLKQYIHCRNCPVFAQAAAVLLDAPLSSRHMDEWTRHLSQPQTVQRLNTESAVVFRIGREWLGLPTPLFQEVAERRQIHTLPHRRDGTVLGLVNVRGELVVCLALHAMLGLDLPTDERGDARRRAEKRLIQPRLLVVSHEDSRLAFPVDEVHGPQRFHAQDTTPAPATVAKAATRFTRALLPWKETSVGLLDEQLLFHAAKRVMA